MGRKRHTNHSNGINHNSPTSSHDEYDISRSFQRIGSYKGKLTSCSSTLPPKEEVVGEKIVQSGASSITPVYTDPNSVWITYSQLDNKISSFQSSNESAHTDLRNVIDSQINNLNEQLSPKIESKLSIRWYEWTVAGIVAIALIFYFLSYSRLLDTVKFQTEQIRELERKSEDNSYRMQSLEKEVRGLVDAKQEAVSSQKKQ